MKIADKGKKKEGPINKAHLWTCIIIILKNNEYIIHFSH